MATVPDDIRCEDIMSSPPVTVSPHETASVAAKLMLEKKIGSLIIVDENGSLLGIVTKTDLVRGVVAPGKDPGKVLLGEIMTRNPYYVTTDSLVREAAEIMGSYGIGHLPVLHPESQRVVGVISMRDIVRLAPHYIELAILARQRE